MTFARAAAATITSSLIATLLPSAVLRQAVSGEEDWGCVNSLGGFLEPLIVT